MPIKPSLAAFVLSEQSLPLILANNNALICSEVPSFKAPCLTRKLAYDWCTKLIRLRRSFVATTVSLPNITKISFEVIQSEEMWVKV